MKYVKLTAIVLCGAILLSGCSRIKNPGARDNNFDLPDNPAVFTEVFDENMSAMSVTVYGRTYTDFGDLKDNKSEYHLRDCLGYVENSEATRIYTLSDDPYDNYIVIKNINSLTGFTRFYRANDTINRDIYTPPYIASLGFECWCDSGLHYELNEAQTGLIINAENVQLLSYEYDINGRAGGGGETGYLNQSPYKKGELIKLGLTEVELDGKADKDKPFTVKYTFKVTDTDGVVHEVKGSYEREMMLGAYLCSLSIEFSSEDGYYIREDI